MPKFNGVYSRVNLPRKRSFTDKRKEEAYAINLDEYLYIGFDCIK